MAGAVEFLYQRSKRGAGVMETQKLQLDGTEAINSGSRSRIYALLARGFRFPTEAEFQQVKDGQFAKEAQEALGRRR